MKLKPPSGGELSMTAQILDGKGLANTIRQEIAVRATAFRERYSKSPKLVAVLVGDDPASQVYIRNKEIACQKAGISSEVLKLSAATTTQELLGILDRLNADPSVHGILVQLPLPDHLETRSVLDRILPAKDVDAFSPENVGLMSQGRPRFLPCTPHGVMQLLDRSGISIRGKEVVVVGRSDIVGKPLVNMCLQKSGPGGPSNANATVTCCHSQTPNLEEITRRADVLLVAIGKPNWITAQMVKPGAVVVDVGINRLEDRLVGDVDFESVCKVASAITPVPGGVGPLTIAMLLDNTLRAAEQQSEQQSEQ
jgi:methylenetetrahydrofolate dehydrogenase (NADP+)/methenyltetrahydrofolate cyclohydrolase